jgi:hypothetical protein
VGHTWANIQDYTLSQIKHFSKAAVQFYKRQNAVTLQTTALGAQGQSGDIEKAIERFLR